MKDGLVPPEPITPHQLVLLVLLGSAAQVKHVMKHFILTPSALQSQQLTLALPVLYNLLSSLSWQHRGPCCILHDITTPHIWLLCPPCISLQALSASLPVLSNSSVTISAQKKQAHTRFINSYFVFIFSLCATFTHSWFFLILFLVSVHSGCSSWHNPDHRNMLPSLYVCMFVPV